MTASKLFHTTFAQVFAIVRSEELIYLLSIGFRYILSLLNKFEVALTWDLRTLLIPSLLPVTESDPENNIMLKVNKSYA